MASVQNFFRWVKERKSKKGTNASEGPCMGATARASLRLPPVPLEDARRDPCGFFITKREAANSPAHIYEEIPASAVLTDEELRQRQLDITKLDFAQAKEFGPYLVVPIKGKSNRRQNNPTGNTVLYPHQVLLAENSRSRRPLVESDLEGSRTIPSDLRHRGPLYRQCIRCHRQYTAPGGFNCEPSTGTELCSQCSSTSHERTDTEEDWQICLVNVTGQKCNENAFSQILKDDTSNQRDSGHVTSSDSTDTCNEYDIHSSELTDSSGCPKSPNSTEVDYNSSVYAQSGSESGTPRVIKHVTWSHETPRRVESDSSNDTFSEYDIGSDESLVYGDNDTYAYYLSKVKHNLRLKQDVMKIIRESESSECEDAYTNSSEAAYDTNSCETAYNANNCDHDDVDDDESLTTVSSLSDISILTSYREDIDDFDFICETKDTCTKETEAGAVLDSSWQEYTFAPSVQSSGSDVSRTSSKGSSSKSSKHRRKERERARSAERAKNSSKDAKCQESTKDGTKSREREWRGSIESDNKNSNRRQSHDRQKSKKEKGHDRKAKSKHKERKSSNDRKCTQNDKNEKAAECEVDTINPVCNDVPTNTGIPQCEEAEKVVNKMGVRSAFQAVRRKDFDEPTEYTLPDDLEITRSSTKSIKSQGSKDKLSCRVTNFSLDQLKQKKQKQQPQTVVSQSVSGQTATTHTASTQKSDKKPDHNRLLTDIMKINHDRQILVFF